MVGSSACAGAAFPACHGGGIGQRSPQKTPSSGSILGRGHRTRTGTQLLAAQQLLALLSMPGRARPGSPQGRGTGGCSQDWTEHGRTSKGWELRESKGAHCQSPRGVHSAADPGLPTFLITRPLVQLCHPAVIHLKLLPLASCLPGPDHPAMVLSIQALTDVQDSMAQGLGPLRISP